MLSYNTMIRYRVYFHDTNEPGTYRYGAGEEIHKNKDAAIAAMRMWQRTHGQDSSHIEVLSGNNVQDRIYG